MQDTSGFHDGISGGKILPELEIAKESPATTVVRKVTTKRKAVMIGFLIVDDSLLDRDITIAYAVPC